MKPWDYEFAAEVWQAPGATWHFVAVPEPVADDIADRHPRTGPGFGAVPVTVSVGATTWSTSVFPDKKRGTYILPMKKPVLQTEELAEGDTAHVRLRTGR